MARILVAYYSRTGNTEKMAKAVAEGAKNAGADVDLKRVEDVQLDDLKSADGIVIGSPTYYGLMAAEVKQLFDRSAKVRGKLENKIGAAFTSSASIEGGNQTTILSILQAMMIHGMIVAGDPMETGGHYGAIAIGSPDEDSLNTCIKLGERVARLAEKIRK